MTYAEKQIVAMLQKLVLGATGDDIVAVILAIEQGTYLEKPGRAQRITVVIPANQLVSLMDATR